MIPEEQLDDVTRGEARNYDHRGHHHFGTGLSTLKTVINSSFTQNYRNFVGVG